MTGLSLKMQLFMCDLSISCISSESSGHSTSSRCGKTRTFYSSQGQVFQERKTGSCGSVCTNKARFVVHCIFFPLGRLVFGCLTAPDPVWPPPRVTTPAWPAPDYDVPHPGCCFHSLAWAVQVLHLNNRWLWHLPEWMVSFSWLLPRCFCLRLLQFL